MSDQAAIAGQSDFPQTFPVDLRNIRIVPNGTDAVFLPAYGGQEGVDLLAAHSDSYSLLSSIS
jgi:hypothetical protein